MLKILIDEENSVRHYLFMTEEQYDVLCYLSKQHLLKIRSFEIVDDDNFHKIPKDEDDYA